jgi:hypothetical protein
MSGLGAGGGTKLSCGEVNPRLQSSQGVGVLGINTVVPLAVVLVPVGLKMLDVVAEGPIAIPPLTNDADVPVTVAVFPPDPTVVVEVKKVDIPPEFTGGCPTTPVNGGIIVDDVTTEIGGVAVPGSGAGGGTGGGAGGGAGGGGNMSGKTSCRNTSGKGMPLTSPTAARVTVRSSSSTRNPAIVGSVGAIVGAFVPLLNFLLSEGSCLRVQEVVRNNNW